MDSMAKEIGEDGAFAIVTSTFTTPNQARWIAEMQAYADKCHPKMKWLETVEAQEDNNLSFNQATTLINKYGDKLKGLFGMTSVATPASAEAVTKAGLCGKVAVVGLATPNAMKPYVHADCVKSVVLVEPDRPRLRRDLRHARSRRRQAKAGVTSVEAGKLGKLNVVNGSEILLGAPFIYTRPTSTSSTSDAIPLSPRCGERGSLLPLAGEDSPNGRMGEAHAALRLQDVPQSRRGARIPPPARRDLAGAEGAASANRGSATIRSSSIPTPIPCSPISSAPTTTAWTRWPNIR